MTRKANNIAALRLHKHKLSLAKAKRLADGRPKWKDEKYMKIEEYEAYIDWFLTMDQDEFNLMGIDGEKAKIAFKMYELKKKEGGEKNPLEVVIVESIASDTDETT